MMSDLRELRNKHSNVKLAVFSRNGIPAIRIGNARHCFIRNYEEFSQLSDDLRAMPAQGRDVYAGADTQHGASGFSSSNAERSDAVQNLVPKPQSLQDPANI